MKTALYALAAVALGLLAPLAARACDYNKVAVVNTVAVGGYVNAVQTVAVPVQAVVAVPTVSSFVAVQPVFVANQGHYGRNVSVVAVNQVQAVKVRNVGGGNNQRGLVNAAVGSRGGNNQSGLINLNLFGR